MKDSIIKKVSAGGVLYHNNKYLIIRWNSENTYELPKGTIERGETKEEACVREVLEETGYNTKIVKYLGNHTFTFDWKDGKKYEKNIHYFLMKRADDFEEKTQREDNEDFNNIWLPFKDAYKLLTHDDMKNALKKAHDFLNL